MICTECSSSVPEGNSICPSCGNSTQRGLATATWWWRFGRQIRFELSLYRQAGEASAPLRLLTKRAWLILGGGLFLAAVPFLGFVMWLLGVPVIFYSCFLARKIFKIGAKVSAGLLLAVGIFIAPLFMFRAPVEAGAGAMALIRGFNRGLKGSPVVVTTSWSWWGGPYIVVTNVTNNSLIIIGAKLVRKDGTSFAFALGPTIPPNSHAEVRFANMHPFGGPAVGSGDVIQLEFQGYNPDRTEFR